MEMDLTEFIKLIFPTIEEGSHSGLIIARGGGKDVVAYGGCPGCLALAIVQKMSTDDIFSTIIIAAYKLYSAGDGRAITGIRPCSKN